MQSPSIYSLAICLIAHYRESRTLVGTTYVVLLAAESGKANLMVLADALGEVEEVVVVVVGCVLYISVAHLREPRNVMAQPFFIRPVDTFTPYVVEAVVAHTVPYRAALFQNR